MAESRFKKYRRILQEEAKKVRAGQKSKVFNTGNITASVLFIIAVCVWAYYFTVKPESSKSEFTDSSKLLKIVFFDVGQGDSTLIVTPAKKTVLIDASSRPDESIAKNVIIPYLMKEVGQRTTDYELLNINYFIVSYLHPDNCSGFVTLIENKIVPETVYYTGLLQTAYPVYQTFLDHLINIQAKCIIPVVGEKIELDNSIVAQVLGPLNKYHSTDSTEDNSSIVLKITYQNISVLFTGNIGLAAETDLCNWQSKLNSTILKISQHGSKNATSSPFLDRVAPSIAVISVGQGNTFGEPSEETIKRLVDRNITVYRTDQNGTITLLTDGNSIKITTER